MFGIPSLRIAELSRPNHHREVADYARLEYPNEEARTILLQAIASRTEQPGEARPRFRLFRARARAAEVTPAKA